MTSKEIVLNEIKRLEHNLKIYEKENMTAQIEYAKTNIIVNNLILKDLEILDILKKCEDDKHSLYCVYVLNALSSGKITQDDVIKIKEWLDNDK